MAATSARSYNRHWRAHKLTWSEIGKIKYLFDGAYEYMDEVTLAYTRLHFNKLRKALGFKQDSELSELVEKAGAFRIVRNRETNQLEAFMSPLVGDRFTPTDNQVIEEPAIPYEIFDCKANALANDNDRDKISENQRLHKNGIDMHVLLAGNVPKFHVEASEAAVKKVHCILEHIFNDEELFDYYFGECIYHYIQKYKVSEEMAHLALYQFAYGKLKSHMSRRVGIENWPRETILQWLHYYFSAKRLPQVITEIHEDWQKPIDYHP
jgi:hypothetical protein